MTSAEKKNAFSYHTSISSDYFIRYIDMEDVLYNKRVMLTNREHLVKFLLFVYQSISNFLCLYGLYVVYMDL